MSSKEAYTIQLDERLSELAKQDAKSLHAAHMTEQMIFLSVCRVIQATFNSHIDRLRYQSVGYKYIHIGSWTKVPSPNARLIKRSKMLRILSEGGAQDEYKQTYLQEGEYECYYTIWQSLKASDYTRFVEFEQYWRQAKSRFEEVKDYFSKNYQKPQANPFNQNERYGFNPNFWEEYKFYTEKETFASWMVSWCALPYEFPMD